MTSAKKGSTASKRAPRRLREAPLTQEAIDERVIAEADDPSAWSKPVFVERAGASIGLPGSLARRAAFLARLHHEQSLESFLERIVRERVELEEGAFGRARRELSEKRGA